MNTAQVSATSPSPLFRLRAMAFLLVVGCSVIVVGTLATLMFWMPIKAIWLLVRGWSHFFVACCRYIVGVRFRVSGLEHLPGAACVYFVKHQSVWETLAFQSLFPHYVWIVKKEAKRIPFFGWGLNSLRPIWIDRKAGHSAVEQICQQGGGRLDQGTGVMIFPEGTRVPVGQTKPFKLGGAILAKQSGAPIVPIAHNSGLFWPARQLLFVRSGVIDIVIGPTIDPAGLDEQAINQQAEQWINQTVTALEQHVGRG